MRTSYGVGRYAGSEGDVLARSPVPQASRGVLLFLGRDSTALRCLTAFLGEETLTRTLADAGLTVMCADWSGPRHWGNDTAVSRGETARAYLGTAAGRSTDKALVVGVSMGSVAAMRYAMTNPARVAAVALILPLPNIRAFQAANTGGYGAEISTAYGGAPTVEQDPASNPASFSGIPVRLWVSSDDAVTPPGPASAFGSAIGAPVTDLGAVGHSITSSPQLPGQVAAFFAPKANA